MFTIEAIEQFFKDLGLEHESERQRLRNLAKPAVAIGADDDPTFMHIYTVDTTEQSSDHGKLEPDSQ